VSPSGNGNANANGNGAHSLPRQGAALSFAPGFESSSDHDFDIDEASRVVRLPLPPPDFARSQKIGSAIPGLPGVDAQVGRGSGSEGALSSTSQVRTPEMIRNSLLSRTGPMVVPVAPGQNLLPLEVVQPKRSGRSGVLLLIGGATVVIGALVAFLLRMGINGEEGPTRVARTNTPGADLAIQFGDPSRPMPQSTPQPVATPRSGKGRSSHSLKNPGTEMAAAGSADHSSGSATPSDLIDLPSDGSNGPATTAQVIEEVTKQASKSNILFTRCYETALKHDPLLQVPKATATVTVTNGTVTNVAIPSLQGSTLGSCLATLMKRWRFPKVNESVTTQLPIVFSRR
jgi:hypothetical protein